MYMHHRSLTRLPFCQTLTDMACQNAASLTQLLPALARSICDVARRPSRLPTHTVPSDLQRNAQPHGLLAPMATFSRASSKLRSNFSQEVPSP